MTSLACRLAGRLPIVSAAVAHLGPAVLRCRGLAAPPGAAAHCLQQPRLHQRRGAAAAAVGGGGGEAVPEDSHLIQGILSGILAPYWESTPTAEAAISALEARFPEALIGIDHLAFRTFGLEGLGISSVAYLFTDFDYTRRDALTFPAKKLRACWYAPPDPELPRVFISEIKVEELSSAAQAVVRKYAGPPAAAALLGKYGLTSALLGVTPWCPPSLEDYETLARESEYAAWVLVNGYALNHTTIAVHRLRGLEGGIERLNAFLQEQGFTFNEAGGLTKVSPDGLLLQSSTVADRVSACFAGGETRLVPGAYIEFAERLVLPEFSHLKPDEVEERHRRDGFETASADRIFESTTLAAKPDTV
ncbi:hypothetical protein C2E20_4941 [Micractinium conductrix]|uniref:2-oxoadipate dioxygenase/decarboxylase n=1 Tax=Micractinium conductrix TaxID=554055 RepID=A0A2P6VCK2_9CHLO|nr:hypothetical protein C2E20_4941 [Micractinium conductrix]|eukprot:PSC71818.1 hypothetical protein C2E20_4941 [Micractinium conductrix]